MAKPTFRLPTSRLIACVLLAATLGGCSYMPAFMSFPPQVRGNKVDNDALAQLTPGTSTRADVTALLGSPTAHATFDDNTWIYISELTRPQIGATNSVLDQQAVTLAFDNQGVLRTIQRKGQDDGVSVSVVSRTTTAPGSDTSFMSMLLGNVGKYNVAAGSASASRSGSQGSSSNPGNY